MKPDHSNHLRDDQKELIDALWNYIKYWDSVPNLTSREKLESLAFGFLNILDGTSTLSEGFDLYRDNNCINSDVMLHELFWENNET